MNLSGQTVFRYLSRFLILLFTISIIWINFHSAYWYNSDMWSDAFFARQMYEQKSFAPEGWLFGNQDYIFATPSLAAIVYPVTSLFSANNAVLAMSVASCLMMVFVMLSLVFLLNSFRVSRTGRLACILFMIGGCILGTSSTKYVEGFQIIYTMCSYYAAYICVAFLCLGIYFRLYKEEKICLFYLMLSCILVFGIGMNSLRELTVLILPLVCMEILDILFTKRGSFKICGSCLYVLLLLVLNLAGHYLWGCLKVPSQAIFRFSAPSSFSSLIDNVLATVIQFLHFSGILLFRQGNQYIPLCLLSICFFGIVACSIVSIMRKKEFDNLLARIIVYFCISLLGTMAVGVFVMRIRSIYYFMYYPLVAFSLMYIMDSSKEKTRVSLQCFALLAAAICYTYNFVPDFNEYKQFNKKARLFSEMVVQSGVKAIYFHIYTYPIVVQYSNGSVVKGDFWFNEQSDELFLIPVQYLNSRYVFDEYHKSNSLICLNDASIDYLKSRCSESYVDALFGHLDYYDHLSTSMGEFTLYKPKSPLPLFYY